MRRFSQTAICELIRDSGFESITSLVRCTPHNKRHITKPFDHHVC